MSVLLVNGVPGAIPADDLGLVRGLSVFDTFRTYGLVPFRLEAHLSRLIAAAEAMDIPVPGRVFNIQVVLDNLEPDCRIRVLITGSGNWVLDVAPFDLNRIGAPLSVAAIPWCPPAYLPSAIKHTNRAEWQMACRDLGVDEVLLVENGTILEANRSNVIGVIDGRLCTPPVVGRALAGVTRAAMLEAAARIGLRLDEARLPVDAPFEELYLSSTLKELAPVSSIGGHDGPGGGPMGAELHAAFRELVAEECGH
jgi:branched-subunit amino acid aminotransferase/4-amino-4-deoxychorismate lyase